MSPQPLSISSDRRPARRPPKVRFIPLRPEHRAAYLDAFERLSPESRLQRFFCAKPKLSQSELDYLLSPDGLTHVALAVLRLGPRGYEPVGVARFVELPNEPGTVEVAITILDAFQGMGLGTLALGRLLRTARELGHSRLVAQVMPHNIAMLRLFQRLLPGAELRRSSGEIEVRADLPLLADERVPPSLAA